VTAVAISVNVTISDPSFKTSKAFNKIGVCCCKTLTFSTFGLGFFGDIIVCFGGRAILERLSFEIANDC